MVKRQDSNIPKVGREEDRPEPNEFEEPKLEFIEPKLTDHGDLAGVTHAFFGTFSP